MSRTLLAGRLLTLLSVAGLAASALLGPLWAVLVFAALASLGLLLIILSPPLRGATGLDELFAAVGELEMLAGSPTDRLVTDTSPRSLALTAARRIREATSHVSQQRDRAVAREQTLALLLDAVNEPIIAADAEGSIVICNAAAQELLGLRADRLVNRPIEEAFTQLDLLAVIQAARRGETAREEVRIPRPDGTRVWATAAAPFGEPVNGTSAIVLTIQDVTQQSLAMQVKTDFVANASHELRTPVSAIRMAVETLEGLGDGEQAMRTRLLSMITSHTHRLEELIRDLLDLTRLESTDEVPHLEPVSASSLAAELASMFEGPCRDRNLTMRFDLARELERLHSDRNLLLLILGNLIDNACKFAFAGTEVLIRGHAGEEPATVRFEVVDQGAGIPINQQQRIFERFFQVDEARTGVGGKKRGTGLGLSIVKHAVRRLGGSIKVHSVWQHGTTMTIDLPGSLKPVTSSAAAPQPQPAP